MAKEKIILPEDFIFPTEIVEELKKTLIDRIGLMMDGRKLVQSDSENKVPTHQHQVWFWTKIVDKQFHPNDYVYLEDQEKIEFIWLFCTCRGIVEIQDIFKTSTQLKGTKAFDYHPEQLKLKDVISFFREKNCAHKDNQSECVQRHYFIGVGDYDLNGKHYRGIHVVLYPVQDHDQTDQTHGLSKIADPIYTDYVKWCKDHPNPRKETLSKKRHEIVLSYMREFRGLMGNTLK